MARRQREHYTRISIDERTHRHPDCGCTLKWGGDGTVSFYPCTDVVHLTDRQAATVLAALRFWQQNLGKDGLLPIADHFEDEKPLTSTEIDRLCERINCDRNV